MARPRGPNRRTISLVRLARLVESRYTCWGCYHRILHLLHTAIVKSCIEAKRSPSEARPSCLQFCGETINAACRMPRADDKEQALALQATGQRNVECRGAGDFHVLARKVRDIQTDEDYPSLPCRRREHTANNQHITYSFKV